MSVPPTEIVSTKGEKLGLPEGDISYGGSAPSMYNTLKPEVVLVAPPPYATLDTTKLV